MALIVGAVWLGAGCASTSVKPTLVDGGIYDTERDQFVSVEEFARVVESADFVIVGESHGNPDDRELMLAVLDKVDASERRYAIALEMFQRPYQSILDAYVDGSIDESEMLTRTEWASRWGFRSEHYAPLWRQARNKKRPLIALNARRELTRAVARHGIEGVDDSIADGLVEIDFSNDAYTAWLRDVFAAHGMKADSEEVSNFVAAQLVWDETMADTAVKTWSRQDVEAVFIVSGRGHVDRGWGIPSRISRRSPQASVVTIVRPSDRVDLATMFAEKWARFIVVEAE